MVQSSHMHITQVFLLLAAHKHVTMMKARKLILAQQN